MNVFLRRGLVFGLVGTLVYGIAACSQAPRDLGALARGTMANLKPSTHPAPAPTTVFSDAQGRPHTLAEFKGRVVIVNIWANWCAPCKAEIPSLAKLQNAYAGKPVSVVAISVGKAEDERAGRVFLEKFPPLIFYTEPTYKLSFAFSPMLETMPATVIYDKAGIERARVSGGTDWSSDEAKAVVDLLLK